MRREMLRELRCQTIIVSPYINSKEFVTSEAVGCLPFQLVFHVRDAGVEPVARHNPVSFAEPFSDERYLQTISRYPVDLRSFSAGDQLHAPDFVFDRRAASNNPVFEQAGRLERHDVLDELHAYAVDLPNGPDPVAFVDALLQQLGVCYPFLS